MASQAITDELVRQVTTDLRARYDLDDDDVRVLGARLSTPDRGQRHAENVAFAQRFTAEHRDTFDRLAQ